MEWQMYLCSFLFMSVDGITVTISGSSDYATENISYTLSCAVDSDQIYELLWYRNNTMITHVRKSLEECRIYRMHESSSSYDYNCTDEKIYRLTIPSKQIIAEDGIQWSCEEELFLEKSQTFTVTVYRYPTSDPSVSGYNGNVLYTGDKLTLACTVEGGKPLPILSWTCRGHSIPATYKNTALKTRSELSVTLNSSYSEQKCVCNASHVLWNKHKMTESKKFKVLYPPSKDPLISGYDGAISHIGENISLACMVKGGNPLAVLSWTCGGDSFPGRNLSENNTAINELKISMIKELNGKRCVCHGRHVAPGYNKTLHSSAFVVYYPPSVSVFQTTEYANISITFSCIANGNPENYIYMGWTHYYGKTSIRFPNDFKSVSPDRKTLILVDLSYQDIGNYTCFIHNNVSDSNGVLIQAGSSVLDFTFSAIFNSKKEFYGTANQNLKIEIPFFCNPFVESLNNISIIAPNANSIIDEDSFYLTLSERKQSFPFYQQSVYVNAQVLMMNIKTVSKAREGKYTLRIQNSEQNLVSTFIFTVQIKDASFTVAAFLGAIAGAAFGCILPLTAIILAVVMKIRSRRHTTSNKMNESKSRVPRTTTPNQKYEVLQLENDTHIYDTEARDNTANCYENDAFESTEMKTDADPQTCYEEVEIKEDSKSTEVGAKCFSGYRVDTTLLLYERQKNHKMDVFSVVSSISEKKLDSCQQRQTEYEEVEIKGDSNSTEVKADLNTTDVRECYENTEIHDYSDDMEVYENTKI